MKVISKKHWLSYLGNIIILFLGILAILYFYNTEDYTSSINYKKYTALIFGILAIYKALRRIILNYRVRWIFENDVLTIKDGFLPWRRSNFSIDKTQIYEAFYKNGFGGYIFKYGSVYIRRTDGVTSKIAESFMNNCKNIVNSINKAVAEMTKNESQPDSQKETKISLSEELRELTDLNRDGIISDDEYQKLKAKIIG